MLLAVRQQYLDILVVSFSHFYVTSLVAYSISGFPGIKMILAGFPLDDLVAFTNLEALRCRFVCF